MGSNSQFVTYEICGKICEFVCDTRRTLFVNNKIRVMLTNTLRAMVNNLFQESIDTTFMGNEKNYQNIFFFPHKNFLQMDC